MRAEGEAGHKHRGTDLVRRGEIQGESASHSCSFSPNRPRALTHTTRHPTPIPPHVPTSARLTEIYGVRERCEVRVKMLIRVTKMKVRIEAKDNKTEDATRRKTRE